MFFIKKKQSKAWYIIKNWWWSYCWSYFIKILGRNYWWWIELERPCVFCMQKSCSWLRRYNYGQKTVLRNESLKNLYYSFLYPYLIYCNQVWGSACKTNIEPLFILQKNALRIITGVHPRSPSEPWFCQLKFLNCENIFKYLVGRLMYRVYHEELTTLQFPFIKNSDIHMHGTRQTGHYHIPLCRTNLGKSSLRYFGALLWNKVLNADINPNVSDFIFSRNLKTAICNNLL